MCSGRTLVATLCLAVLLAPSIIAAEPTAIRAVTRPSADVTLSFVQPGRIMSIRFEQGDQVEAGQVIVQQDDAIQSIQMAQARAKSQSKTQIYASEASLEQKKVDLQKIEKAAASNAATELEVEHAKLDVKIAEFSLEIARFENKQAQKQFRESREVVRNMRVRSPIAGRIEEIPVEVGESVNALEVAARVVRIDPLWIDVPVPLKQATKLNRDSAARVVFQDGSDVSIGGKVIYVATVAEAASGTLSVRVELPNKRNRPAGEHVLVFFNEQQQTSQGNAEDETKPASGP